MTVIDHVDFASTTMAVKGQGPPCHCHRNLCLYHGLDQLLDLLQLRRGDRVGTSGEL